MLKKEQVLQIQQERKKNMALDKQISIYSVDTGNFYSNKERALHNLNCKLRMEKNELKSKLSDLKDKIKTYGDFDTKIHLIDIGKGFEQTDNPELNHYFYDYKYYTEILKSKRQKIKKSKQDLLDLLNRKIQYNIQTEGKHHKRELRNIDTQNIINIFDSSVTRLTELFPYELSENLMVVQVYYFDVFKDIFYYGFTYKGEEYIYFTSSAGQIRTKKGVFIKKSFYEEHEKTLMCGLTLQTINEKGGNNPNKHFAYMALTNSATDLWEDFDIDRTIVVDDFETEVPAIYDLVDDETYTVIRKKGQVPIPHTDGAGMILPELSEYNFMVRLPWIKGLLGSFDYKKFIQEKGCSPIVKDIYGKEHDVIEENIQIIFTKSQFKLWKYYDSWDQYKEYFKKYHCTAGICNDERTIENMHIPNVTINYQMLQTLTDITDEEIMEITEKTRNRITDLCSSVRTLQRAFNITPKNVHKSYLQKAIQAYPNLMNDEYLKVVIRQIKNSMVKNAKAGKLSVKGKYTFLLPDFYAFCEWLFMGIEVPNGLLDDQEVYCRLFDESKELDCLRSPHLYLEHAIRENVAFIENEQHDEISKWFNTDGIYTSTKDILSKLLQFDDH